MAKRNRRKTAQTVPIERGRKKRKYSGIEKEYTKFYNQYDYILMAVVILLCVFGIVMIYSASGKDMMTKQLLVIAGGLIIVFLVAVSEAPVEILRAELFHVRPDPKKRYRNKITKNLSLFGIDLADDLLSIPGVFLMICFFMQILVYVSGIGKSLNYSKRWISLGPVQLQPSEFTKVGVILFMAYLINKKPAIMETISGWLEILLCIGPETYLILRENMSSALIIVAVVYIMILIASRNRSGYGRNVKSGRKRNGFRFGHVKTTLFILMIAGIALVIWLPHSSIIDTSETASVSSEESGTGYRGNRIKNWKRIENFDLTTTDMRENQTVQGLSAIASGGITGKGIGNGVEKLHVQERTNDMIMAVIFEELGLVGVVIVVIFYFLMCWRLMVIGCGAQSLFQSFICFGVMAQFILQMILNLGVVTNFIPNTGISLPFISYGGSAMLAQMIETALVFRISGNVMLKP